MNTLGAHSRKMDMNLVQTIFPSPVAESILQTHLHSWAIDKFVWGEYKSGQYTVKFTYHFSIQLNLLRLGMCTNSVQLEGIQSRRSSTKCKKLWNLSIPSKIKKFAWRVSKNSLPIKLLLNNLCGIFQTQIEDQLHALCLCSKVTLIWNSRCRQLFPSLSTTT